MTSDIKRKTSLSLSADVLNAAKALGIDVSAVSEAALKEAVDEARRRKWLAENADAFAAQSEWHELNGHPLQDILAGPGGTTWKN